MNQHEYIKSIEKNKLIKDPKLPLIQKGFDESLKTATYTSILIQVKTEKGIWTDGYAPSPDFIDILKKRGQEYRYVEQSLIIERKLIEEPT